MNIEQLRQRFAALEAEWKGLSEKEEALSDSESARAEGVVEEMEQVRLQIEKAQSLAKRAQDLAAWNDKAVPPVPFGRGKQQPPAGAPPVPGEAREFGGERSQAWAVPAEALRSKVTSFKDGDGLTARQKAFGFGMWFLATVGANQKAREWCLQHDIALMGVQAHGKQEKVVNLAHGESINSAGGFLVPPQFENDLIDLREQFGVVRRLFRNRKMTSDTLNIPRRTNGLTAYFATDSQAATESVKGWDNVELVAKKIICLAKFSSELAEDAIIDIGNDLAAEIAYAFAGLEDDCGLNGNGTSPYGGITGIRAAFTNLNGTIANIAGLVVASGTGYATSYGGAVLTDFTKVKGRLPRYADSPRTCWVCHKSFYHTVMESLALAAGGVTAAEVEKGLSSTRPTFLGYPVEFAQKMPSQSAINQVVCLFGDFSKAAEFGDRRMSTIALSEHAGFANDEMWIRGTERFDINVHDVGNASATASQRQAGPV